MLNIKNVFSPPQTEVSTSSSNVASNVTTSSSAVGPSNPTPAFHPAKKSFLKQPKAILGGLLMLVLVIGGISAFSLSQKGQDLRQQASGSCTADKQCPAGWYCNKNKGECMPPKNSGECQTSADCPGGGTRCVNNKCVPNDQPTLPPAPTGPIPTGLENVTCDDGSGTLKKQGEHSCTDSGPANCVVCGLRGNIGVWLATPGQCTTGTCKGPLPSAFPTQDPSKPTPTRDPSGIPQCQGAASQVTCTDIATVPGSACLHYQTCQLGGNYNACTPQPGQSRGGNSGCLYTTTTGAKCTDACPGTMSGNMVRCQCSGPAPGFPDGVWTVGTLPAGGSCAQLCGCTNNTCVGPTCQPSPTKKPPGPTTPPPTTTPIPTLPPGPQCTNIKMFDLNNNELTGNEDQGLKPGQAVKFRCMGTGTITRYEFRVLLPDGTVNNKATTPALNTTTNITGAYALPMAGHFTAQCRICYQPPAPTCPAGRVCNSDLPPLTCLPYEPAPTVPVTPAVSSPASTGKPNAPTQVPQPGVLCGSTRCKASQTCYQPPMPTCRPGRACAEIIPAPYCR